MRRALFDRRPTAAMFFLASIGAGQASAQDACTPLACDAVYSGPRPTPVTDWKRDDRPVAVIRLFNGSTLNEWGLQAWWYDGGRDVPTDADANSVPDAFDRLLSDMTKLADDGWQRIVLNVPAGSAHCQQKFASGQWWTMPAWKRDGFHEFVTPWIDAHPDVSVGVYMGYEPSDPCSLCMVERDPAEGDVGVCADYYSCPDGPNAFVPDIANADHMCIVHQNIQPWIDAGFHEMWFDFAAGRLNKASFIDMASSPTYRGKMKFGGEAYPRVQNPDLSFKIDTPYLRHAPWMALMSFIEKCWPTSHMELTVPDPDAELAVGFMPQAGFTFDLAKVKSYRDRGFVLWSFADSAAELIKRVDHFGTIANPVDFDADGAVDEEDLAAYAAAYDANATDFSEKGYQKYFLDGDMNNDECVTTEDYWEFFDRWYEVFVLGLSPEPLKLLSPEAPVDSSDGDIK